MPMRGVATAELAVGVARTASACDLLPIDDKKNSHDDAGRRVGVRSACPLTMLKNGPSLDVLGSGATYCPLARRDDDVDEVGELLRLPAAY